MTSAPSLRASLSLVRLQILGSARRLAPTESQRLFVMTLLIGAACGLAAVGFHFAILLVERLMIERALVAPGRSWIVWCIVSPAVGGLIGVTLGSAIGIAYASPTGRVPARDAIGKFLLGALQIGSGGSLGREGPNVQICAGLAGFLGRYAPISPQGRRRLLPVGAAAGIAAAFNAPIAAVTFTIEEVVGKLDQSGLDD